MAGWAMRPALAGNKHAHRRSDHQLIPEYHPFAGYFNQAKIS